jgi:ABC-type uncharacterized transport system substrate-binding protein
MSERRFMRSNAAIDAIRRYLMLLLFVLILGGCSRKPPGDSVSFSDSITPCKKEGYKKVLVVHSYYPDYGWVQSITRGLRVALDSKNVDLQFFYMDTKRNPSKDWMVQKGNEAKMVIGQWNPDVIITVDDNAQEYVGKILAQEGKIPVVFCGVNASPQQYGYPASNVTGVLELPHFKESISFLKKVLGKDRPLRLVVMSDSSVTTDYAFDAMKAQIDFEVDVLDWCKPVTFDEWKRIVQDYQSKADAIAVYVYHTVLPSPDSKQSINPQEIISWTIHNSDIPILGFFPFSAEDGSVCGVLESGLEQGKMAGQMALKILQGAKPANLEIQTSLTGQPMLNLDMARKLGIQVSDDVISQVDILIGTGDKENSI